MNKPRILFLFSDTGGGHRSAAEAIIEALEIEYPQQFQMEMLDVFQEYAPLPFNFFPDIYPGLTKMPRMWEMTYNVSDGKRRMRVFYSAMWPYLRRSLRRLLNDHPAELIVSVHQLVNTPVLRARVNNSSKFVTVVTDLVTTHSAWFHPRADLVIVPTINAKEKALKSGLPENKVVVIGQPIAEKYIQQLSDPAETRRRYGWLLDLPLVLLVGGGEGMGHIEQIAMAINHARLRCQLIVIAGRNEKIKKFLEQMHWFIPFKIYGFVTDMPEFMQAADVLITKAGPGTISEAFISGLPIILFSKVPGQENGNVDYVVKNGAGVWAPEAEQVLHILKAWLNDPITMGQISENSRKLARPLATHQIARALADQVRLSIDQRR